MLRDSERRAARCEGLEAGMKAKRVYQCPTCEQCYRFEIDAESCCPRDVMEVWQCEECQKAFEDMVDANACCTAEDANADQCLYCPTFLTPEDLRESALVGSLKLCAKHRPKVELAA